jgi:mannose-6-phosphate isomerase-like protein (cupin superfamily)
VVCVDNFFSSDLRGFLSSYTGEALVGIYHTGGRPDVRPEEMATVKFEGCERYPPPERSFLLTDFREKVKPPLSDYVGIGIYIFPRRIFPILDEFCGGQGRDAPGFFIQHLVERGEKVRGYLFTGEWYDVSHKSYLRIFSDARLVRSDERYVICDKSLSEKLVASITILHPGKQTTGHSHPGAEVYFFVEGEGEMEVDGSRQRVGSKDIVLIRPNQFHRVYNTGDKELIFVVAFEKYGERG